MRKPAKSFTIDRIHHIDTPAIGTTMYSGTQNFVRQFRFRTISFGETARGRNRNIQSEQFTTLREPLILQIQLPTGPAQQMMMMQRATHIGELKERTFLSERDESQRS